MASYKDLNKKADWLFEKEGNSENYLRVTDLANKQKDLEMQEKNRNLRGGSSTVTTRSHSIYADKFPEFVAIFVLVFTIGGAIILTIKQTIMDFIAQNHIHSVFSFIFYAGKAIIFFLAGLIFNLAKWAIGFILSSFWDLIKWVWSASINFVATHIWIDMLVLIIVGLVIFAKTKFRR